MQSLDVDHFFRISPWKPWPATSMVQHLDCERGAKPFDRRTPAKIGSSMGSQTSVNKDHCQTRIPTLSRLIAASYDQEFSLSLSLSKSKYIYIYMYVYIYICMYIYTYVCIYIYVCISTPLESNRYIPQQQTMHNTLNFLPPHVLVRIWPTPNQPGPEDLQSQCWHSQLVVFLSMTQRPWWNFVPLPWKVVKAYCSTVFTATACNARLPDLLSSFL